MANRMLMAWLGCCLAAILATPGCSGDATTSGESDLTGSLSLALDLTGEAQIEEVWYQISGNSMPPMAGFIDTSAPGATASVEVFGLAPGFRYLVDLRAIADDGTSCEGSAPFDVTAGAVTEVGVMINCKPPEQFGSVRVNGKLNVCAHLEKAIVSPLQTTIGYSIDLSAEGADAEKDSVSYRWSASGGPVSNPSSPVTKYTCAVPGLQVIRIDVSDDDFRDCIDTWTVEVRCVGDGGGAGGMGGAGGTGGTPVECVPQQTRCSNGEIDPIIEDPACMLNDPPSLPNACSGSESLVNPPSCSLSGITSTLRAQMIAVAGDCNAGFNLDRCDGETCNNGGLAPGEGLNGVDNALTGLAPILAGVGGNLGGLDQALYDGLCSGSIDWVFEVDTNLADNCATVVPVYDGSPAAPVILNVSDLGCVSGTLGDIPLSIAGEPGVIGNATVRGTADGAIGFDVMLGGTADAETAVAIAESLLPGAGAVVAQVFDINSNLESNLQNECNALSLTFDVAGVAADFTPEGACTNPEDAALYSALEYDTGATTLRGPEAASQIASDCVFGNQQSDPRNPGCGPEAQAVLICGGANCPDETIQALAECVSACQQTVIEEATGETLTPECNDCYSDSITCSAVNCATAGCTVPDSPPCVACRCANNCTPAFDRCSGLPPSGECSGAGGSGGTGGSAGSGGTGGSGGGASPLACDDTPLPSSLPMGTGLLSCDALGVLQVPIETRLVATPLSGETAGTFVAQAQLVLDEATVGQLGALLQQAVMGEASVDVDQVPSNDSVNLPARVPCTIDFTRDSDSNGAPGPIEITTRVEAAQWMTTDGTAVVEATDATFEISQPVPLTLSTKGGDPACVWEIVPRVIFEPGSVGTGG